MTDRHMRRSGDDYIDALAALLPTGPAWPREVDSTLMALVGGLSQIWGNPVDSRAADLLERESDPRITMELLPDWERAFGLPDECFPPTLTVGERQAMLVLKMTWLGAQSREYFIELMAWLGYSVTIKEFAPFMAGVSNVGDTRPHPDENFRWYIGPPEMRFYWTVSVDTPSLVWFRASSGQAGVDHHLEFREPTELLCLLERWKPAHTQIVMDTSGLAFGGPMQGTP
jgi:uncharacterized protein YmfQ (DUF2313 family)